MLTWELIGAVIGAGLASGREVASFFSRFGHWSWLGIIAAVIMLVLLANTGFPVIWRNRWPERTWRILLSLLLIATGGAMLSGGGEVAALVLPIKVARWMGIGFTLLLAWFLAHRTKAGLAWVSCILMMVMTVLIILGLTLPPMRAVPLYDVGLLPAVFKGIAYGGFNAALQHAVLSNAKKETQSSGNAVLRAALVIGILLMLGNLVLLRHSALLSAPMPFVMMLRRFGQAGYLLGACSLYLAILSTLTACLRGLGNSTVPLICIVAVSLLGFSGVVEGVYPLLGAGCFLMLAAGKFMNSYQRTFHSSKDMI